MRSEEPTLLRRIVRGTRGSVRIAAGSLALIGGFAAAVALVERDDDAPGAVPTVGTSTRPSPTVTVTVTSEPPLPGDGGGGQGVGGGVGGGGGGDEGDIDDLLEGLELGNVAFNSPTELELRQAAVIQLRVSGERSIEELQEEVTAAGELEGEQIRISDSMEAHLTGRGFAIESVTPEVQLVARRGVTEWKWEIEPTETGERRLHLTLSALVDFGGDEEAYTVRTFERTLLVRVALTQRLETFVDENWQWLWTTLLVPLGGWLLHRRRRRAPETGTAVSPR